MKLYLYYPISPYNISQNFGDSLSCIEVGTNKVAVKINGVCPVGYQDLYAIQGLKGHSGIDSPAVDGQPCYYAGPIGQVEEVQTEEARGLGLGIITQDAFEMEGGTYLAKTRYWHLKGFNVKKGDIVKTGDLIGWCDNTGYSSGTHLHFEVKPVGRFSDGGAYNIFQSNGFYGACDPKPYFNGQYANDLGTHLFTQTMSRGGSGQQVVELQKLLRKLGFFTYPDNTGFYGALTQQAVFLFQLKYVDMNFLEKNVYKGFYCGKKTLIELNKMV